jgi:hypothetical protein
VVERAAARTAAAEAEDEPHEHDFVDDGELEEEEA